MLQALLLAWYAANQISSKRLLKFFDKERIGAKVSKKYDDAKTPYQRVLLSEYVSLQRDHSSWSMKN